MNQAVSPVYSRSPTPLSAENASAPEIANAETILRDSAVIIHDLELLRSRVLMLWREQISAMLPEGQEVDRGEELATQGLFRECAHGTKLTPSPREFQMLYSNIYRDCWILYLYCPLKLF
jgi:hypothetical protein